MTDRRPAAPEDAMIEGEHLLGNRMQAEPAANAAASRASIWNPPSAQEPSLSIAEVAAIERAAARKAR